jgi:hypothetical protein
MFTQFLHTCFGSDLPSVSLVFQCGPDCITLCWDEETCVVKFPLKVLWMCWYHCTAEHRTGWFSTARFCVICCICKAAPHNCPDLLHATDFQMQHVCTWTGLRPVVTCSNGWLQSWEIWGAQSCLPADGVFWDLTLCLWPCCSRRFVDARYQWKRRGPLTDRHNVISQKAWSPMLHIVVRRAADIGHLQRQVTLSWDWIDLW